MNNNSDVKRGFKGVWIPKEVWLNKELTIHEKVLLVEIESLDNEKGCYVKNKHFMELLNLKERRIQDIIKSLVDKGFIKSTFKYKKGTKEIESRILRVNISKYYGIEKNTLENKKVVQKIAGGGAEKSVLGSAENCVVSNSLSNTLYINIYNRVIDYLNKKTNKSYRSTTKKTQSLIKARLKEGFTEEDFIKVIDKKVLDWENTEFSQYLRPETLFGTKFEGYLNQKVGKSNGSIRKNNETSKNGKYEGFKPAQCTYKQQYDTEDLL